MENAALTYKRLHDAARDDAARDSAEIFAVWVHTAVYTRRLCAQREKAESDREGAGLNSKRFGYCSCGCLWASPLPEVTGITSDTLLPMRQNIVHKHGCTAVGDGNTSPITKLYEFCHLLPTVRIFSPCLMHCMHSRIQKVKDKVMVNDHRS